MPTDRLSGLNLGVAIKLACSVASTGNLTLSGVQTVDGVQVGYAEERILVRDQTDQRENGPYVASTGDWVRSSDGRGNKNFLRGTLIYVSRGSVFGRSIFCLNQDSTDVDSIVIGNDELIFTFAGAIGSSQIAQSSPSTWVETNFFPVTSASSARNVLGVVSSTVITDISSSIANIQSQLSTLASSVSSIAIPSTFISGTFFPATTASSARESIGAAASSNLSVAVSSWLQVNFLSVVSAASARSVLGVVSSTVADDFSSTISNLQSQISTLASSVASIPIPSTFISGTFFPATTASSARTAIGAAASSNLSVAVSSWLQVNFLSVVSAPSARSVLGVVSSTVITDISSSIANLQSQISTLASSVSSITIPSTFISGTFFPATKASSARTAIGAAASSNLSVAVSSWIQTNFLGASGSATALFVLGGMPSTSLPQSHSTTHKLGGTDVIGLDELAASSDVTTLNVSTTAHGLMPKLGGNAYQYFSGLGTQKSLEVDSSFAFGSSSSYPYIAFAANDYFAYSRALNRFEFVIGGTLVAFVDIEGVHGIDFILSS